MTMYFFTDQNTTLLIILNNLKTFLLSKVSDEDKGTTVSDTEALPYKEVIHDVLIKIEYHKIDILQDAGSSENSKELGSILGNIPKAIKMLQLLNIMVDMYKPQVPTIDKEYQFTEIQNDAFKIYKSLFFGFIYFIQHMIDALVFIKQDRYFTPNDMRVFCIYYKVLCDYRKHILDLKTNSETNSKNKQEIQDFLKILLTFLGTVENIVGSDILRKLESETNDPMNLMVDLKSVFEELSKKTIETPEQIEEKKQIALRMEKEAAEKALKQCENDLSELQSHKNTFKEVLQFKHDLDNVIQDELVKSRLMVVVENYKTFTEDHKDIFDNEAIFNQEINKNNQDDCNRLRELVSSLRNNLMEVKIKMINFKEDIRGSVRIFVKVKGSVSKPENWQEGEFPLASITYPKGKDNSRNNDSNPPPNVDGNKYIDFEKKIYGPFYNVFKQNQTNLDGFNKMESMFQQVENGYHIAIFGYGYSGAGKTYTLLNNGNDKGILLQAISYFMKRGVDVSIHKMFELYINEFSGLNAKPRLTGKTIPLNYNTSRFDTTKEPQLKTNAFIDILDQITTERKITGRIKKTINNPESSRSHLFITLKIGTGYITICDMGGREDPFDIYHSTRLKIKGQEYKLSCSHTKDNNENCVFNSGDLSNLMIFDKDKINVSNFLSKYKNNLKNEFRQPKALDENVISQIIDTLKICFEGFYINETINHLTWYFKHLNGVKMNRDDIRIQTDSLAASGGKEYNVGKCFSSPYKRDETSVVNPDDNILMLSTLEELKTLSSQDKPTKFVMMACVRQEGLSKYVEFSQKTLDFAESITSTIATIS